MIEILNNLTHFARYPFALRKYLKDSLTVEEARKIIHDRLDTREERFLRIAEQYIYNYSRSPYLQLLKMAGCELGDLRALVKQKGLEDTLRQLREAGVYAAFEEFKGRKPIVRGGQTLTDYSFQNPGMQVDWQGESSGSTGVPFQSPRSLEFAFDLTSNQMVTFAAHDVLDTPMIIWRGILPDNSALSLMMRMAKMRRAPVKWFSHMGLRDSKSWVKYALSTYFLTFGLRLNGAAIPLPEYVPVDQADVIARSMAATLKQYGRCLLNTQVSRGLRVSLAAQAAGIDLTGATFMIAGEPPTPAKVREIERVGARYFVTYGAEAGRMAMGCANPEGTNDVHLMTDAFALITFPEQIPGFNMTVPAFNITSLLESTPTIMLNLAVDDYGIVEQRHCGCELESLGWMTHLRDMRSYRKLTGEGVTMVGSEMLSIIENVLPALYGGTALDYQLLEQENDQGLTKLYIVISPRLEIVSEQAVVETVYQALRASNAQADAARSVWQQAGMLQIKRMEPIWTSRGKLMPLYSQRDTQMHPTSNNQTEANS
jgi:hypothetical protein